MGTPAQDRAYYEKNRAQIIARNTATRRELQQLIRDEKKRRGGCSHCGEDDPVCLDFHHLDPAGKEFCIGNKGARMGRQRLIDEMAKCLLLCANCHRKEHAPTSGMASVS